MAYFEADGTTSSEAGVCSPSGAGVSAPFGAANTDSCESGLARRNVPTLAHDGHAFMKVRKDSQPHTVVSDGVSEGEKTPGSCSTSDIFEQYSNKINTNKL